MKRICLIVLFAAAPAFAGRLLTATPAAPQRIANPTTWPGAPARPTTRPMEGGRQYRMVYEKPVGQDKLVRPYLLYLPEGYERHPQRRWPLILFLHGGWESGEDYELLMTHGPPRHVEDDATFRATFPFIVLSPQCPRDCNFPEPQTGAFVMDLLDQVCRDYRADPQRVYMTGLSWGAIGTYTYAMQHPDRFAAIAPICGKDIDPDQAAAKLKKVPIWTAVGEMDYQVYKQAHERIVEAVQKAGGIIDHRVEPGVGHEVWLKYYAGRELYDWFLRYKLPAIASPSPRS